MVKKLNASPRRMGMVSELITLDILQEALSSTMRLRKEIKGTQIVKKIIKPPLCVDDINYYTEIPLHSTKQKKVQKPQKLMSSARINCNSMS